MSAMIDLLDEVRDPAETESTATGNRTRRGEAHACDGCGEAKPDVDLWATNSETGEEVWLCLPCGDW